jgi:hypothetical protein
MLLPANEGAVSLSQLGTPDFNFKAREKCCKLFCYLLKVFFFFFYLTARRPSTVTIMVIACAADAFFTLQLGLASPGLLHVKKIQEWSKRNSLHQENHPEVKYFLDKRQNKNYFIWA